MKLSRLVPQARAVAEAEVALEAAAEVPVAAVGGGGTGGVAIRIRSRIQQLREQEICQVVLLEIGVADITLAGLHLNVRAFNSDEPIRLRLTADRDCRGCRPRNKTNTAFSGRDDRRRRPRN